MKSSSRSVLALRQRARVASLWRRIEAMHHVRSTEGRDTGAPVREAERRAAAIAAMGYRLAAAGPRTRQRLLDREAAPLDRQPASPMDQAPAAAMDDPLPALSAWDDAAWERRISGEPEPALARLSVERTGFPVWRAAALLASAACGFSLVLWGQSLHLERTSHRSVTTETKPMAVTGAAVPSNGSPPVLPAPQPVETLSSVPALAAPVAISADSSPPALMAPPAVTVPASAEAPAADRRHLAAVAQADDVTEPPRPARTPALPAAPVPKVTAAPPSPPAREAAARLWHDRPGRFAATQLPARQAARAAAEPGERARLPAHWVSSAVPRPPAHRAAAPRIVVATADFRPHAAARYEFPRWLTDDRPEHATPLIMSPKPHNLEPPPGTEVAEAKQPPAQATLPPIPEPRHRPPQIYAEAPPPTHPFYNSTPYYGGNSQTYGYTSAMPPPTPYGEP